MVHFTFHLSHEHAGQRADYGQGQQIRNQDHADLSSRAMQSKCYKTEDREYGQKVPEDTDELRKP